MLTKKSGCVYSLAGNEHLPKWDAFGLAVASLAGLAMLGLWGCAGLVSGAGSTSTPPPSTLQITNVQVASATTSTCQIVWTTNVAANSAVNYGASASYGSSTPVDSTMVTNHQVTISGLAAGTTYYYEVLSTDSTSNHGKSGGHTFKTSGFSISGAISPAAGGSGATLTLSGAGAATAMADSTGNYSFAGLANGMYTVTPSHAGYMFSPGTQNVTVSGASITGVNFTDAAQTFSISGTLSPAAGGSGATVTLSGGASATTTSNASGAYSFTGLASGSYNITPSNTGYSFSPGSQSVTVSMSNVTGVNFTDSPVAVAPTITTQPATVSFGKVVMGITNTQTIVLTNSGSANLIVSQASVSGSGFSTSGLTLPLTLSPGQSANFNIAFAPAAVGSVSGNVSLVSNAASSPTIITLSGNGLAATSLLTANPTTLSFGNVNVGSSSTLPVALTNTGNSAVTIASVTATGTEFSTSGLAPPLTLTAGQSATLNVVFAPTTSATVSGSVTVASNATNSPAAIALSGSAHSVDLSWTASSSVAVGYNVYHGTQTGGPYTRLTSAPVAMTSYTDSTVQSGQTYFYVVTAVDANNVESVYSNETSAIIP